MSLYARELCSQERIILNHVRSAGLQGHIYTDLEYLERRWDERMHRLWGLRFTRELPVDLFFENGVQFEIIVVVRKRIENRRLVVGHGKVDVGNSYSDRGLALPKPPNVVAGSWPPHPTLAVQHSPAAGYPILILLQRYALAPHVRAVFILVPASVSPFTEPTSPNPTATKYAQTTESLHTYGSYLTQCLPKFIQQFSVLKDELILHVAPSAIVPVLTFLRDHSQCQFKSVVDITAVDFPEREKRFEVVYNLLSVKHAGRIRVKTYAGEADPVPSAVPVFRGADWYEREVWDMFGVFFSGHPDL